MRPGPIEPQAAALGHDSSFVSELEL